MENQVLAQVAFAAGAEEIATLHQDNNVFQSTDLQRLQQMTYGPLEHGIFSAHQMGGLSMGVDPKSSVVNPQLRHHQLHNLYVVDGSVLPTSLGVNPSQTIYALGHRARREILNAL